MYRQKKNIFPFFAPDTTRMPTKSDTHRTLVVRIRRIDFGPDPKAISIAHIFFPCESDVEYKKQQ